MGIEDIDPYYNHMNMVQNYLIWVSFCEPTPTKVSNSYIVTYLRSKVFRGKRQTKNHGMAMHYETLGEG